VLLGIRVLTSEGNAFRFQPSGVLFSSPDAYRTIYNAKANIKKGKFYETHSRNIDMINTFNTTDKIVHARRRRILASVFSEKAIRSAETFVLQHVDRWNELLLDQDGETWSQPRNMTDETDHLIFDILGDLCFGRSFETKEPGENPLKAIPHAIASTLKFFYPVRYSAVHTGEPLRVSRFSQLPILDLWVWLKPRGLDKFLESGAPKDIKYFWKFVDESAEKRIKMEEEIQKEGSDAKNVRQDMFHYLVNAKDPVTGGPALSRTDLIAEANLLVVAGADTTACGFFFYISRNPHVYTKLTNEIRSTFQSVDEI
jgi:cytochrome P450